MAKALIRTSFPSTTEVARKLGLSASRIQHVAGLMDLNSDDAGDRSVQIRKRASKQGRAAKASRAKR
jgi:hypothetical protein